MSVDILQDKIRKTKNPSVVDFNMLPEHIPPQILETEETFSGAWERYCKLLLQELKGMIPAVRFSMAAAIAYGVEGLYALAELLRYARELGYYVLLDYPNAFTAMDAQRCADILFSEDSAYLFDGLILSAYIGSDALRAISQKLAQTGKSLFVLTRTANKSAQDLQDLLTGSRLVHMAMADIVSRFAQPLMGKKAYSLIGVVATATSASTTKNLRTKYPHMFLLLDGYDAPGANAKNCSGAFDRLGFGAAACAGVSVTAAWQEENRTPEEYAEAAKEAVERMKRNLGRYVTIF